MTSPTDWNWFYSSLAQSTAAIVGLFGAFIFTKIINNEHKFKENENTTKKLLRLSEEYKNEFKILYNSLKDLCILDENYKNPTAFHRFFLHPNINIVQAYNELQNDILDQKKRNTKLTMVTTLCNDESRNYRIKMLNLISKLQSHINENITHSELLKSNSESSLLIYRSIIVSFILFLAGVIIPLNYLPVGGCFDLIKIILLASSTIIVSGIFLYFFWRNKTLQYKITDINELENWAKLENYSQELAQELQDSETSSE